MHSHLQLGLLNVDALLDLASQDFQEQLAVCIPGIFPEPKKQIVATLQMSVSANHGLSLIFNKEGIEQRMPEAVWTWLLRVPAAQSHGLSNG